MSTLLWRLSRQIVADQGKTISRYTQFPCFRTAPSFCFPRHIVTTQPRREDEYEAKARKLNQKGLDEHEKEVRVRQRQVHRPWHRQDADKPPIREKGDKEPVVKGMQ